MRYLTILLVSLLASCSWSWPWRSEKTGNCLDDDSCEGANPFEEQLIGGTWYCYGVSKNRPWDCSQQQDNTRIAAYIGDSPERVNSPEQVPEQVNSPEPVTSPKKSASRVELQVADSISYAEDNTPPMIDEIEPSGILNHPDSSFAVQLIALPTLADVDDFTRRRGIDSSSYVRIKSQGADWYVVLLGVYPDQMSASAAADAWEADHDDDAKPWVRPIGPLKDAERQADESA